MTLLRLPASLPRLAVLLLWALLAAGLPGPASAQAPEAQIKQLAETRLGTKIESVSKAPYPGMYELVLMSGGEREIYYTDEKVTLLLSGSMIDIASRRNLTQERLDKLSAIRFEDLPFDLAIKQVRGNGKRVMAMFSDPFYPFCKRLDASLATLDNVTIYTFLYPILRKESPDMASRIWCSPDRAKAYNDLMLRGREPSPVAACRVPTEKWLALGNKLGIAATPVSYTNAGVRVVGARFEDLTRLMDEATTASAAATRTN
jgi:thiol:disulfide interchange protein DsbC